jgi:hypothetical protein
MVIPPDFGLVLLFNTFRLGGKSPGDFSLEEVMKVE